MIENNDDGTQHKGQLIFDSTFPLSCFIITNLKVKNTIPHMQNAHIGYNLRDVHVHTKMEHTTN